MILCSQIKGDIPWNSYNYAQPEAQQKTETQPIRAQAFYDNNKSVGLLLIYYLCYLMGFEAVYMRGTFCREYTRLVERSRFLQGLPDVRFHVCSV